MFLCPSAPGAFVPEGCFCARLQLPMMLTFHRFSLSSAIFALCCGFALPGRAQNGFSNPQPYPAVRYEHRTGLIPPQRIEIVRIDLSDPNVEVRVAAGGADPDGDGPYQTTLQTPTTIAARERFEVAVNGDFFGAKKTVDVEGEKSGYVADKWALAIGPAATDGYIWAPASSGARPALILDAAMQARLAIIKEVPGDARQVIAGSHILLSNGRISVADAPGFIRTRHPRTAVGIADNGETLVLVVVDGRRAEQATGMSLPELAQLMLEIGCRDALNLDGGGSSELVIRDPRNGQLQVVNRPSDNRERAVANVLGISIRGSLRAPKPAPVAPAPVAP